MSQTNYHSLIIANYHSLFFICIILLPMLYLIKFSTLIGTNFFKIRSREGSDERMA